MKFNIHINQRKNNKIERLLMKEIVLDKRYCTKCQNEDNCRAFVFEQCEFKLSREYARTLRNKILNILVEGGNDV